jgi:hypothetical protein
MDVICQLQPLLHSNYMYKCQVVHYNLDVSPNVLTAATLKNLVFYNTMQSTET